VTTHTTPVGSLEQGIVADDAPVAVTTTPLMEAVDAADVTVRKMAIGNGQGSATQSWLHPASAALSALTRVSVAAVLRMLISL
jgi:hypothetical protein